ncbi:hypothetical protein Tph_c21070 [Thermacetogenium phaeum DSM 12270]|uniref:Uncharacterized protein n=1 Tax=Thermacetogenium phaeum (strain ATCC BAA-254 / DSM 26808 / PB) TaxID=1089553 RepID=K4LH49_THEPS|nr:hypothetical protein Tph_c21070 [Thermacetogenium phaeum DSM 12270]
MSCRGKPWRTDGSEGSAEAGNRWVLGQLYAKEKNLCYNAVNTGNAALNLSAANLP